MNSGERQQGPELGEIISGNVERLISLREPLGYVETDDIVIVRDNVVQAAKAGNVDDRRDAYALYQELADHLIGDDPEANVRFGYLIALADLRLECGNVGGCLRELEEIKYSMQQHPDERLLSGADDIAKVIKVLDAIVLDTQLQE